jgi:RHS repeat-associated protein
VTDPSLQPTGTPGGRPSTTSATETAGQGDAVARDQPSLSLPKAGGAIRGMGEKFTANPVTGTASMAVPVALTAGRGGSQPRLSLSYDSGAGNAPFGLGWSLDLPSVSRRTDKGIPRYDDDDVFQLTGAEDLVPALTMVGGSWQPIVRTDGGYEVTTYRPRTEGLFARIERWRDQQTGVLHWQVTGKDNITNVYGSAPAARIADPADPSRTFRWLLEQTTDDRGNIVRYEYKQEDRVGVDLTQPWERNRGAVANQYLKRVFYGNSTPGVAEGFCFEVVLDYGEHDPRIPTPDEVAPWQARLDPYSTYRSGFEIRCYRLCQRILMFHRIAELGADPVLVASTDLTYAHDPVATKLTGVTHRGYRTSGSGYVSDALPTLTFSYTERITSTRWQPLTADAAAVVDSRYQWVDLDGEGIAGMLAQQDGAWYYRRNLGDGGVDAPRAVDPLPVGASTNTQLLDLGGDGLPSLTDFAGSTPGFYHRTTSGGWSDFATFPDLPPLSWHDGNLRTVDLTGDGLADILLTGSEAITWYPSEGFDGYGQSSQIALETNEERGPRLVFADAEQSVYLADMTGDGLTDLLRVRNGEIAYWPNLGYGRFGPKVAMAAAPVFDHPDRFDQRRIRLADVDGSATTDLLYLGNDTVRVWYNQAGNSWSAPESLDGLPWLDAFATVSVIDLLGHGTACLVTTQPAPDGEPQIRYLDLMAAGKPHLLSSVDNGMGSVTSVEYASSTSFYLADLAAGRPWLTTLPFPVQVIEQVRIDDSVAATALVSTYRYRHGHYDGVEREFRGFGYVEQRDAFADTANDLDQPPSVTKRWQHTGWYVDSATVSDQFRAEYWQHGTGLRVPDSAVPSGLTADEQREAARALRGRALRVETYAEDGTALQDNPYQIAETNYLLRLVQPQADAPYCVVFAEADETLTVHSERQADDPRVAHALTLAVDEWGNVINSAQIVYARVAPLDPEQAAVRITYSEHDVVNDVTTTDRWRIGVPVESRDYEVGGLAPTNGALFGSAELVAELAQAAQHEIPYQETLSGLSPQRRLIARTQQTYYSDDLGSELPLGQIGSRALPWTSYRQVFAAGQVTALFGERVTDDLVREGGYQQRGGTPEWWAPSGRQLLDPQHFYLPTGHLDPFGSAWRQTYDPHFLIPVGTTDPLGNTVTTEINYRVVRPWLITDANGNRSGVRFDLLGMVVATAVLGKPGLGEGDVLDLTTPEPARTDDPTTRLEYDLTDVPVRFHTFAREQHGAANPRWQESWTYFDGTGRTILVKAQAEPVASQPRWVGTGRTIYNNKGNPVKQYEPYFATDGGFDTEASLVQLGVTPILHYDPLGRLISTDFPDGSLSTVVFNAWEQQDWDRNDTVLTSRWYSRRITLPATDPRYRAATLTAAHAGTYTRTRFNTLGQAHLVSIDNGGGQLFTTTVERDIQGNELSVTDARSIVVLSQQFDMLGRVAHSLSVDAGERWLLTAVDGKPSRGWDSRGTATRSSYDLLRRPTHSFATPAGTTELLRLRYYYGEQLADAAAHNLLTRPCAVYDGAGVVQTIDVDFKGNTLTSVRQLTVSTQDEADWSALATVTDAGAAFAAAQAQLESAGHPTETSYDALNRPVLQTSPDGSVTRPTYNEANLLEQLDVQIGGATAWTPFITNIDYNARGQRVLLERASGARTVFSYEPDTFRLSTVDTRDPAGDVLQSLSYTYDPTGNVVETDDAAQQTLFFANAVVTPNKLYTYEPSYRLSTAEGREHIGQTAVSQPGPYDDPPFEIPHVNDAQAMRRYTETYGYDATGNIVTVAHSAGTGSWTRRHDNAPDSNRLLASSLPGDAPGSFSVPYTYDANGNLTSTPQLSTMIWDVENRLVQVDLGGGGTAYYQYDASGQRVRATVVNNGTTETRTYLGASEIYQKVVAGTLRTERQTLHVTAGGERIALVETTTTDANPAPVLRYQLTDHLGSAVIEIDGKSALLSYEEYHPYGTTSFRSATGAAEVSVKRYRFTGKEKDAETGLYYHGARYYACWLGRWTSPDPAGLVDGTALYNYVRGNPARLVDPNGKETYVDIGEDKELQTVARSVNDSRPDLATPPQATTPAREVGKEKARTEANTAAARVRKTQNITDSDVQAGHTQAARHTSESGAPNAQVNDPATFQHLHSRKDKGLNVTVTNPDGTVQTGTRHTTQEKIIDEAVDKTRPNTGGKLTPEGQAAAGDEVRWRTQGTGYDQREVVAKRESGTFNEAQAIERSPAVQASRQAEAAPKPGVLSEVVAGTAEFATGALKFAGQATTVVGAYNEAAKTVELEHENNRGALNATAMGVATFAGAIVAGVLDDGLGVATAPMGSGPVLDSWQNNGSGPVQHAMGEFIRDVLNWGAHSGL